MADYILKKPLKIQATPAFQFKAGTKIETTGRHGYFRQGNPPLRCSVILVDGREYLAYQPDIDEAIKD